jgi:hypothetical protein
MVRMAAILLAVQLASSACTWLVGTGFIDPERLPDWVLWLLTLTGPAALLIHGKEALFTYFLALCILTGLLGALAAVANPTMKKWILAAALLWWLACGFVAATVGV